jgi:hypothetical protein
LGVLTAWSADRSKLWEKSKGVEAVRPRVPGAMPGEAANGVEMAKLRTSSMPGVALEVGALDANASPGGASWRGGSMGGWLLAAQHGRQRCRISTQAVVMCMLSRRASHKL